MAGYSSRSRHREVNAWPGWVDALSSLVMVVIFLLMVFVVGQVFTAATLSRRDAQLSQVTGKVAELNDLLALERRAVSDLRIQGTLLSEQLRASVVLRDQLTADIAALRRTRDKLEGDVAVLARLNDDLKGKLAAAQTAEGAAAEQLKLTDAEKKALLLELGALRDRSQALAAELADARERTMLAQKTVQDRDAKLAELSATTATTQTALDAERQAGAQGRREIETLNSQIAALRDQLARIAAALEVSEKKAEEQRVQIVDLGSRLNQALASKVQELARYRSEFFGRVREALGNRPDVRIVGDRFVFQSELLFPSGAAVLEPAGRERLGALARTLIDVAALIPADIHWVLRVDGHTDVRPIATKEFPSNWELSAARAISVVKFLIEQGIPADRLAAAGFGEHQPLDPTRTEEALSRNRRIELKLDQR
jgi:chemotaxis protein MotB